MIEWDNKYSVKISIIDEQHKELINIINLVIAAKENCSNTEEILEILNQMIKYTQTHFKTEESYMIKFNYPEYQYHKEEHDDFSFKVIAYHNRVIDGDYQIANEILEFLKQWLVNHIQKTDRKYIDCFKRNGLE